MSDYLPDSSDFAFVLTALVVAAVLVAALVGFAALVLSVTVWL